MASKNVSCEKGLFLWQCIRVNDISPLKTEADCVLFSALHCQRLWVHEELGGGANRKCTGSVNNINDDCVPFNLDKSRV